MVNRGEVVVKCVVNVVRGMSLFSGLKLRHGLQLFFWTEPQATTDPENYRVLPGVPWMIETDEDYGSLLELPGLRDGAAPPATVSLPWLSRLF
jgi:hypothetical protein